MRQENSSFVFNHTARLIQRLYQPKLTIMNFKFIRSAKPKL